jgi:cyclopropane fatty-acyl-phospholipid synthase-like methyltransferase
MRQSSSDTPTPYRWDLDNPHGYANRIGRYRTRVETDFLFNHIGQPPQRILDMGGGSGRFAGLLVKSGHHVTLIDRDPRAVAMATLRDVQRASACDIVDFNEKGFDIVIGMEVLEYFQKCETLVSKAAECLNSGGKFVFCALNSRSWRFRLRGLKNDSTEVNGFTMGQISHCLRSHGFEIIACQGFQWSLAQTGSNSFLVDVSMLLEKGLKLRNWLSQSPWLLYACRKCGP